LQLSQPGVSLVILIGVIADLLAAIGQRHAKRPANQGSGALRADDLDSIGLAW
jgi:hypothetical protein